MKVEYLPSFLKDLKSLKSTPVFEQIKGLVFDEIPNLSDLQNLVNLKKLKGDDNAYRLRVGDYRIGFYFEGETVTFARVLHRKDIYRYFPP
ncbi:type II toxin-antitoxin system RelE/ParE family toxin [Planktothrix sp. FACHB-1365]|uniref:type II toxin-antitoxin system RelE family toxin n=1 Tax=Planktothrix sp. FACHB-1365 TaxID=2692855 RepID=UPI001681E8C8|nr:type II toxin-antitoxin system RelE/ParE family toxin [Planktothrix sp. FACHB-1365]MBD2485496.1 type II toxin-antitoxin system RelE/ParE family toxin [Planktothrix sp. FACHB-1365]